MHKTQTSRENDRHLSICTSFSSFAFP